ncbi:hypothetical protein, partial [[Mycoplasma] falconis]|uniref:hypothetical protein n=1 Tax=[Mycoplasma] falconis TaxID=92403 RepID=UPI001B880FA8
LKFSYLNEIKNVEYLFKYTKTNDKNKNAFYKFFANFKDANLEVFYNENKNIDYKKIDKNKLLLMLMENFYSNKISFNLISIFISKNNIKTKFIKNNIDKYLTMNIFSCVEIKSDMLYSLKKLVFYKTNNNKYTNLSNLYKFTLTTYLLSYLWFLLFVICGVLYFIVYEINLHDNLSLKLNNWPIYFLYFLAFLLWTTFLVNLIFIFKNKLVRNKRHKVFFIFTLIISFLFTVWKVVYWEFVAKLLLSGSNYLLVYLLTSTLCGFLFIVLFSPYLSTVYLLKEKIKEENLNILKNLNKKVS